MDASKSGTGRVWFSPGAPLALAITPHSSAFLQNHCFHRTTFPQSIQDDLVSSGNPSGTVLNSNLELARTVSHDNIIPSTVPVAHLTTCNIYDNTPAVAWRTKGSNATAGPADYTLQVSALHQHHFCYKHEIFHILGTANSMAKYCSMLWHLNDSQLISYFSFNYPQIACWKTLHLLPEMNSAVI